jgi:HipA-like protein
MGVGRGSATGVQVLLEKHGKTIDAPSMPIMARRLIRKMRGGAQSHLIEAEDGHFYVVKFRDNPQHRRILVNELISHVLLRYLQIAVPDWALVEFTPEFLSQNPQAGIELGAHRIPASAGVHFGSKYPGDPARVAVYDFLPDVLLRETGNLSDFLGALVFDKWVANADSRQSVFFRARLREWTAGAVRPHPQRMGFVALMIDHGFAFNGPHWEFPDSANQGLYLRKLVYEGVRSLDDFQPWLEQVTHFPEEVIDDAWKQIPPEWLEDEEDVLEKTLERLMRRRARVADLVSDCRTGRADPFPRWR